MWISRVDPKTQPRQTIALLAGSRPVVSRSTIVPFRRATGRSWTDKNDGPRTSHIDSRPPLLNLKLGRRLRFAPYGKISEKQLGDRRVTFSIVRNRIAQEGEASLDCVELLAGH